MSNVVTHERFNRPKVHQPHPRKRKGVIRFRKFVWRVKSDDGAARVEAPGWFARYRAGELASQCRLLAEARPWRTLISSRDVAAQVWIDGKLPFGELLEMLHQGGLDLRSVKDENGVEGLFITEHSPPEQAPPAA
jgi:hypothetical protein